MTKPRSTSSGFSQSIFKTYENIKTLFTHKMKKEQGVVHELPRVRKQDVVLALPNSLITQKYI